MRTDKTNARTRKTINFFLYENEQIFHKSYIILKTKFFLDVSNSKIYFYPAFNKKIFEQ